MFAFRNQKVQRYRRARIRAMLVQDQQYGDTHIKVLKFVEISDIEQIKKEPTNIVDKALVEEAADLEAENDQDKGLEGVDQSDRDSQMSGNTINDDLRQIKENKSLISEKNVPKSIKCLQRTVILLLLSVITIACKANSYINYIFLLISWFFTAVELTFRFLQRSEIQEGVSAIDTAYNRTNVMTEILFYTRQLQFLAK